MCLSSSSSSINLSSVYHLSIIYLSSIDLLSIIYLCIICHLLVSHCTHHTRRPHACTWAHMCAHSRGHTWGSPPCRELTPGALPVTSTPASSPHFPPPFFPRSAIALRRRSPFPWLVLVPFSQGHSCWSFEKQLFQRGLGEVGPEQLSVGVGEEAHTHCQPAPGPTPCEEAQARVCGDLDHT